MLSTSESLSTLGAGVAGADLSFAFQHRVDRKARDMHSAGFAADPVLSQPLSYSYTLEVLPYG